MKMKWQLLNTTALVRKPADEAGAGGEGGESGAQDTEGAGAAEAGGEGGQAGEGAKPGDPPPGKSSILDFASKGDDAKGGESDWKLPDGLEIPDHLVGLSAEETLAKLSTAYKGARQELSTRKRADGVLEGAVPKDIDGYKFEGDIEKDPVAKELMSEESKPFLDAFREAALELGIPDKAFTGLMQGGIKRLVDAGKLNALADSGQQLEDIQKINGEAEFEALVKDVGQAGARQALAQTAVYKEQLKERGILQNAEDEAEYDQMFGTARALKIFQRMLTAEFGQKPIPLGDGHEGAPTLAEAYAKQTEALNMKPGSDRDRAVKEADAMIKRALGSSPQIGSTPGKIRSSVL